MRVCVEVQMEHKLLECIPFVNEFGIDEEKVIEYEWLPNWCSICKRIGHSAKSYLTKPKVTAVWKPKNVQTAIETLQKKEKEGEI